MSKKATKTSRAVAKALASSNRAAQEARQASDATRLAKDAVNAAIAATCAAERVSLAEHVGRTNDPAGMRKITKSARLAAEEAVEHAKDAMRSESEHDVVGAVCSADLSVRAARRASSLAAAASVLSGKTRELASTHETAEPTITVSEKRTRSPRENPGDALASSIERAAQYLVTYNGAIIASFAREEDAFLLESELADLDQDHGVDTGKCEVIERKTGHRLGGYMLTGGQMLVFLRNERDDGRGGRQRRK